MKTVSEIDQAVITAKRRLYDALWQFSVSCALIMMLLYLWTIDHKLNLMLKALNQ